MSETLSIHGQWSSRLMFILAASGSAVGLGNIWKFPYITGQNGGGAFVLFYLFCVAIIGLPIMVAEVLIGRRGRQSPINTMRALHRQEGASALWVLLGWGGVVAGFLILSYYSVIAGWALAYVFRAAAGVFTGATADGVKSIFSDLISDPERLLAWHTLFMVMTVGVVARGVRHGLESAIRFMMPLLFGILLLLVGYAFFEGAFDKAWSFMFTPDLSKLFYKCAVEDGVEHCVLNREPMLIALGHAFFTLSLGMGAIMVYGSYMPKGTSIAGAALTITFLDTLVALLAGLAIFPIVFANGMAPDSGPGLVFKTLPLAFGAMPFGSLFGTLFFLLLVFAAWSSAISLIEPAVAWLVENRGMSRIRGSLWVGLLVWFLGLGTIFSFNIWSGDQYKIEGMTLFDLLDFLTANIMLPLGGLFIALFAGWSMKAASTRDELAMGSGSYLLWRGVIRYITPVAVTLVFLQASGLLDRIVAKLQTLGLLDQVG